MIVLEPTPATQPGEGEIVSETRRSSSGGTVRMVVARDFAQISDEVARQIASLAQSKQTPVFGLATGSTPIGVYDALVRLSSANQANLSSATSFNLDEYYPMEADSPHSYHTFMREHLFERLTWGKWHVPSGRQRPQDVILQDCAAYEDAIRRAGGIDLQLLGIGRTGHVGFNEPGSPRDSRTRLVDLSPTTREDAANTFNGLDQTPKQAVSMGIGTILEAKQIILMATGPAKADILRRAFCEPITPSTPASYLQEHPAVTLYLDAEAASRLS